MPLGRRIGSAFERHFPDSVAFAQLRGELVAHFFTGMIPGARRSAVQFVGRVLDNVLDAGFAGLRVFGRIGREMAIGLGQALSLGARRIGDPLRGMWRVVRGGFRATMNWIIRRWNSISFGLPAVNLGPLGHFGGGDSIRVPQIPELWTGGVVTSPGSAWVADRGPELVHLPRGASVVPLPRVPDMPRGEIKGRPTTINLVVDSHVLATVVHHAADDAGALL
jgi:hypothetical protein